LTTDKKQKPKPKVTVYSDYICPFCYIGKNRVERLEEEFDVDVEWKGFEIHPETPEEGRTIEEMGFNKEYIEMARTNVNRLANQDGLEIKLPPRVSNSRLALEISEYAKQKGKFKEFYDAVFNAYWKEGRDIGSKEYLFQIAEESGLKTKELKTYLEEGRGHKKLNEHLSEVRSLGITGVPTFIVGDKMIVGAQPYEVLKKAALEEKTKAN
jgi:predicted DsbA family dithiol-disulfide isomerase